MMKEKLNSKKNRMTKSIKLLSLLSLIVFPLISFSQQDYDIKLKIHDIDDSSVVIKTIYGKEQIILDTLYLQKDGTFHFIKKNVHKGIAMVSVGNYDIFTFLFDKSNKFEIEMDGDWNYVVKGCQDNDLYFEFQKANSSLRKLEYDIKKELKQNKDANKDSLMVVYSKERESFLKFQKEFYKNYPNHIMTKIVQILEDPKIPKEFYKGKEIDTTKRIEFIYYFRTHYWDNFDFSDDRIIGTPYFFTKLKNYMNEITIQKGDSVGQALKDFVDLARSKNGGEYAQYAIKYYINANRNLPFAYNEERFVSIVDKVVSPEITTWLTPSEIEQLRMEAEKLRPLLPNQPFTKIIENDFDGKAHSLYDLKNKYTIVYFWSAGCESCKKNLEVLEKFYKEYKNVYDFEIFSIDLDNKIEESLNFRSKHPFDWIVLKSNSELLKEKYNLDIQLTPDLYILDKDKKIINHTPIYSQIESTIKNLEGVEEK